MWVVLPEEERISPHITLHCTKMPVPRQRRGLSGSVLRPVKALAARYNSSEATARKGRGRETAHDRSHARHPLPSSLNVTQEALMVGLRRDVGLSLNEIVEVMRRCHDQSLSRSAIYPARGSQAPDRPQGPCPEPVEGRSAL